MSIDNFYILNVISVSQLSSGTGGVFTGKITFGQLLTIHRLTERKESTFDPFGEISADYQAIEDVEFQRHLNESKLTDIRKYLFNEIEAGNTSALFPSSVIISLDINENNSYELTEEDVVNYYSDNMDTCFVINTSNQDLKKLFIPKTSRISLIVDGQHRFYGLKRYYERLTQEEQLKAKEFEFITTILLGFDPYQIAEVFANVNFHQKPVNRSLYYDIFGSSSNDRNEIQLAHFLALHMQNNEDSPIKDMIKLLGKGYGLFSQAFFVEKILIHFSKSGVWESLFEDFKNNKPSFMIIPDFLKAYFNSIQKNYAICWPQKVERDQELVYSPFAYGYILCKTTGMGAFLRLVKDIYKKLKDYKGPELETQLDQIFSKISIDEANLLFSKQGDFGGGGSEGLQVKLYRHLKTRFEL